MPNMFSPLIGRTLLALALCGSLFQASGAAAADDPAKQAFVTAYTKSSADPSIYAFNYGDPTSTVLPLVGVDASQITQVETVRKFGLALAQGDSPAIGLEISPYWALAKGPVSLDDYRAFSPAERAMARTKLSLGVSKGNTDKSVPSSVALSISSKFLTGNDALFDSTFEKCLGSEGYMNQLDQAYDKVMAAPPGVTPGGAIPSNIAELVQAALTQEIAARQKQLDQIYAKCVETTAKALAARSSLDAGLAVRASGKPGQYSGFSKSGLLAWATWSSGSFGPGATKSKFWANLSPVKMRAVAHLRYTANEALYDKTGARTAIVDSTLVAVGLENVPQNAATDRLRWALQAGETYRKVRQGTLTSQHVQRYLLNTSLRIGDEVWLQATLGHAQGKGMAKDDYVLIGFSFVPSFKSDVAAYYEGRKP